MDFAYDAKTQDLIGQMEAFMDEVIYPAEPTAHEQIQASIKDDTWSPPAILEDQRLQDIVDLIRLEP